MLGLWPGMSDHRSVIVYLLISPLMNSGTGSSTRIGTRGPYHSVAFVTSRQQLKQFQDLAITSGCQLIDLKPHHTSPLRSPPTATNESYAMSSVPKNNLRHNLS